MTEQTNRSALERTIAYFAPSWALKRARSRAVLSMVGYDGASFDKPGTRFWTASHGSADAVLQPSLPQLRARSRDLERNDALARGAINTQTTNVVGQGLRPLPEIDREYLELDDEAATAWERSVTREWSLFSESIECDLTRYDTFGGLQSLAFRSVLANGDAFALLRMRRRPGSPYDLKIQLIEGDRVDSPPADRRPGNERTIGGIATDADGAPIAVWIASQHPGEYVTAGRFQPITWARVPIFGPVSGRRNVLHLVERQRIGQTRGEPYLAPVMTILKQLSRYTESELMAALVNSCFAVTSKTVSAAGVGFYETQATDERGENIDLVNPGQIVDLERDESLESFAPNRPNSDFDPFFMAMTRNLAAGLEQPHELIIKHFTASYSASRGALLEAWRFYRKRRAWVVHALCQPVYEAFLDEAVAKGRLTAPGWFDDPLARRAWASANWIGPAPGHIQPKQEAEAAEIRMRSGLTTLAEEIAGYSGGDWERKHAQQVKEREARRDAGLIEQKGAAPAAPAPATESEAIDDD